MADTLLKSPTPRWRYYVCGMLTLIAFGVFILTLYDFVSSEAALEGQTFMMQQYFSNNSLSTHSKITESPISNRKVDKWPIGEASMPIPPTSPSSSSSSSSPSFLSPDTDSDSDSLSTTTMSWLQKRQALLAENRPTLVFLFCYMRGGSSILGEMFNQDPRATMWYEPGDAFFAAYHGLHKENFPQNDLYFPNGTRRSLNKVELGALTDYYSKLLTCDLANLPPEALAHYFLGESNAMDGYMRCERMKRRRVSIDKCADTIGAICSRKSVPMSIAHHCHLAINETHYLRKQNPKASKESLILMVSKSAKIPAALRLYAAKFVEHEMCRRMMAEDNARCLDIAVKRCKSSNVRVVQVNRIKMEDVEPLIELHPDIRIVHYSRDPRAIALSRIKTRLINQGSTATKEAKFLCDRMAEDQKQRLRLENKYPGIFMTARYENLAADPVKFADDIYSFWGSSGPDAWAAFTQRNMHSPRRSSGFNFGVVVSDPMKTANKWRTMYTKEQLTSIQDYCGNFLRDIGYQIIT